MSTLLARGFKVWVKAANVVFPGWVLLPGAFGSWAKSLDVGAMPIPEDQRVAFFAQISKGGILDIVLSDQVVLQQEIIVPVKAIDQADRVLELKLKETSPVDLTQLHHKSVLVKRDKISATYLQVLVRKKPLAELIAQIEALGGIIRSVSSRSPTGNICLFTKTKTANRPVWNWWGATALAFTLSFTYLAVVSEMSLREFEQHVETSRREVLDLRTEAVKLSKVANAQATEHDGIETLAILFNSEALHLEALLDLTNIMPDTVWVSEMNFVGTAYTISGFSQENVPSLIEKIDDLPWAGNVQLTAPVIVDRRTGDHRFEISLTKLEAVLP